MRSLIAGVLSLIICGARPAIAGEYVLRVEVTTDVASKIGDDKPLKTSAVQTLEILIAPERRFHGKTNWENHRLTIRGKLTQSEDGALTLDVDCGHFQKVSSSARTESGHPMPEIENRTTAKTKLRVTPGKPLILGGAATSQTTETPRSSHSEKRTTVFRLTIVEDDAGE